MTDNQRLAIDELTQYREARKNIQNLKQKIEMLETKCNKITRAPESLMQQTIVNGEIISVPVVIQNTGGNCRENVLDALMDARGYYWQRQTEAEQLCMRIERLISDRCTGVQSRILSMHYLYNCTFERIAVMEKYSYQHIRRLYWAALERYGARLKNESSCS